MSKKSLIQNLTAKIKRRGGAPPPEKKRPRATKSPLKMEGNYASISACLSDDVAKGILDHVHKSVYGDLLLLSGGEQDFVLSYKTLSKITRLSKTKLFHILNRLAERGLITKKRQWIHLNELRTVYGTHFGSFCDATGKVGFRFDIDKTETYSDPHPMSPLPPRRKPSIKGTEHRSLSAKKPKTERSDIVPKSKSERSDTTQDRSQIEETSKSERSDTTQDRSQIEETSKSERSDGVVDRSVYGTMTPPDQGHSKIVHFSITERIKSIIGNDFDGKATAIIELLNTNNTCVMIVPYTERLPSEIADDREPHKTLETKGVTTEKNDEISTNNHETASVSTEKTYDEYPRDTNTIPRARHRRDHSNDDENLHQHVIEVALLWSVAPVATLPPLLPYEATISLMAEDQNLRLRDDPAGASTTELARSPQTPLSVCSQNASVTDAFTGQNQDSHHQAHQTTSEQVAEPISATDPGESFVTVSDDVPTPGVDQAVAIIPGAVSDHDLTVAISTPQERPQEAIQAAISLSEGEDSPQTGKRSQTILAACGVVVSLASCAREGALPGTGPTENAHASPATRLSPPVTTDHTPIPPPTSLMDLPVSRWGGSHSSPFPQGLSELTRENTAGLDITYDGRLAALNAKLVRDANGWEPANGYSRAQLAAFLIERDALVKATPQSFRSLQPGVAAPSRAMFSTKASVPDAFDKAAATSPCSLAPCPDQGKTVDARDSSSEAVALRRKHSEAARIATTALEADAALPKTPYDVFLLFCKVASEVHPDAAPPASATGRDMKMVKTNVMIYAPADIVEMVNMLVHDWDRLRESTWPKAPLQAAPTFDYLWRYVTTLAGSRGRGIVSAGIGRVARYTPTEKKARSA